MNPNEGINCTHLFLYNIYATTGAYIYFSFIDQLNICLKLYLWLESVQCTITEKISWKKHLLRLGIHTQRIYQLKGSFVKESPVTLFKNWDFH